MNISAIKGFSIRARRKLIEDITQKAFALGIKDTKGYEDIEEFEGGFRVQGANTQIVYPVEFKSHRDKLITEINRKGFEQVIEEVAYTWFNRIIAIRYMEINEYLPVKVRILSSLTAGKVEPDVLTGVYDYIEDLELDREKVFELKESHRDEELFKYVFIKECNKLGTLMPQVFEKIGDFTELLLPDQLLTSGSVIRNLIESIEEDSFKEEVEIIGWMYQYYISEKKDEVFAALKKNKKITKEDIPAATQLFTPKWIVKYMTENSLGRLWQESHPNDELKSKWEYYIEPAKQELEIQAKLDELKNPNLSPEDIKILDPAMGSGHILVYAFDLLYGIYLSRGYAERDIPQLILEKNLYGLDIDDRAAQLATFALLMKGRSKNRRFFRKSVEVNVCSIKDSNRFSKDALKYLVNQGETQIEQDTHLKDAKYLVDAFKDAKEYGSILNVKTIDFDAILRRIAEIEEGHNSNIFEFGYKNEIINEIEPLIKQAQIMSRKYDVVITNPPYMGKMPDKMTYFVRENYAVSKYDLYSVFIDKSLEFAKVNGFVSLITQHTWMFISSFNEFRHKTLDNNMESLVHLGTRAFESISGDVVQTASFVLRKIKTRGYNSIAVKLTEYNSQDLKEQYFLSRKCENEFRVSDYQKLPGYQVAYWLPKEYFNAFDKGVKIDTLVSRKAGVVTGNDKYFIRQWYEVNSKEINFNSSIKPFSKYHIMSKGGSNRRFYGNYEQVVKLCDLWNPSKTNKSVRKGDEEYYFKKAIGWSQVGNSYRSFREVENSVCGTATPTIYLHNQDLFYYMLAFLNSKVAFDYLEVYNPTINLLTTDICNLPIIIDQEYFDEVSNLSKKATELSKLDWDLAETSWDFNYSLLYENSMEKLVENRNLEYIRLKVKIKSELEKIQSQINKIFFSIYDVKNFSAEKGENVTIDVPNESNGVRNLISFIVGNMFGRFSLESSKLAMIDRRLDPLNNDVLLISEEDYFKYDLAHKFIEYIKVIFGDDTLDENLKYISNVINPKSKDTSKQIIRKYFVKEFYKDHCKTYKRNPIYWMIDSGKQNGVKALFYMHDYDKTTIAKFRTDYLHEIQRAYENDIGLTMNSTDGNAKKRVDVLNKKLAEVNEFDKVVAHVAHQQIEIDLDDGVEHNYELFQGIEVPQGDGQKPIKRDLLAKRK